MPERDAATERVVYCLTRDRDLATAIEERLSGAIAFFYNDAARLHQAVLLRAPELVLVDTGAIREEYGDAGLGPVTSFLRERCPAATIAVRPMSGVEHLVAAEAGPGAELVPHDHPGCVEAVARLCGCA
ncbi:MAG TPA: hypothetical protein VFQ81_09185 [Candidatus Limnocylindria bacterium]|nr:hypothetical protein [Candidatus Limnocylindria bacterium]